MCNNIQTEVILSPNCFKGPIYTLIVDADADNLKTVHPIHLVMQWCSDAVMQRNAYSDADADAVMHTMMLMLRGIHTIQWWKLKNCSAHPFNLCNSLQQWELANPMHRDHSGEYCQYFILVLTLPSANTNCPWGICHSLGIDHRWENGYWPYTLIQPIKEYTASRFPSGNLLVLGPWLKPVQIFNPKFCCCEQIQFDLRSIFLILTSGIIFPIF